MRIRYETRNGRKYAYTCTSKRVPGKKNPVSEKVYLGVVNPETGEIETQRKDPVVTHHTVIEEFCEVREYGTVLALKAVADRCGMTDTLSEVYGEDGRIILAAAIAKTLSHCTMDEVPAVIGNYDFKSTMGLDDDELTSARIRGCLDAATVERESAFSDLMSRDVPGIKYILYGTIRLRDLGLEDDSAASIQGKVERMIKLFFQIDCRGSLYAIGSHDASPTTFARIGSLLKDEQLHDYMVILDGEHLSFHHVEMCQELGLDYICNLSSLNDRTIQALHRQFVKNGSSHRKVTYKGRIYEYAIHRMGLDVCSGTLFSTADHRSKGEDVVDVNIAIVRDVLSNLQNSDALLRILSRSQEISRLMPTEELIFSEFGGLLSEYIIQDSKGEPAPSLDMGQVNRSMQWFSTSVYMTSSSDMETILRTIEIQTDFTERKWPFIDSLLKESLADVRMTCPPLMFKIQVGLIDGLGMKCDELGYGIDKMMAEMATMKTIRSGDTAFHTKGSSRSRDILKNLHT